MYPLTLLSSGIKAQKDALELLKNGVPLGDKVLDFRELQEIVGFDGYWEQEDKYAT